MSVMLQIVKSTGLTIDDVDLDRESQKKRKIKGICIGILFFFLTSPDERPQSCETKKSDDFEIFYDGCFD